MLAPVGLLLCHQMLPGQGLWSMCLVCLYSRCEHLAQIENLMQSLEEHIDDLAEQQYPNEAAPRIQLLRCRGPGKGVLSFLKPV